MFRNRYVSVILFLETLADTLLNNYGDWLPKEFGGNAEMDGSELIRSILAEKEYLEQLRKTCDVNVLV